MNENIEHYINTEAIRHNAHVFTRICTSSFSPEKQRMKIIEELVELYEAYNVFGSDQFTVSILKDIREGNEAQAVTKYELLLKNTARSELADVVIATLSLMTLTGQSTWTPGKGRRERGVSFLRMIGSVANGMSPDEIIDWCVVFANSHDISIRDQIEIKIFYNARRTDW